LLAGVTTNHASFCFFHYHLKASLIGPRVIYHWEALHGRRYCFWSSFALVNVSVRSVLLDTMSIRMSLLSDDQQFIETECSTDITPEPSTPTPGLIAGSPFPWTRGSWNASVPPLATPASLHCAESCSPATTSQSQSWPLIYPSTRLLPF
jgi:hypothetical protein